MGAAAERFLEDLREQRAAFMRALPAKAAGMVLLWREIEAARAAPDDLERLVRLAHGLAGSAGMFGFSELGAEARALELDLGRLAESGTAPGAAPGIESRLMHLQALAAASR